MTQSCRPLARFTARTAIALLAAAIAPPARAQEASPDALTVPFSDPSRPGLLKVGLLTGSITVTGYDGKEVVVEARRERDGGDDDEEKRRERDPRAGNMRRLPNTSTGLAVEEDSNVMEVRVGFPMHHAVDLLIRVPASTSLELSTVNDGDIVVRGVEGEIDVNNTNGEVSLTDVSGSVVAHALNGDVVVSFVEVDPKKSMSFSSLNGNIDVTFPAGVRADVRFKADNGEVYTDFDVQMSRARESKVEEGKKESGKKYVKRRMIESALFGKLNGGGPNMRFETFNGNIYIRKRQG